MQLLLFVECLGCGEQVLHESVAEFDVDLIKTTLALAESIEVLIDILPLLILLLGFLLKVSEEVALHLFTVKEIVPFVYYTLKTTASDGFAFFHHAVIVVTLTLVLWLGVDVDAK